MRARWRKEGRNAAEGRGRSLRQRRSYGARVRTGMSYVILLGDSLTGVAWRMLVCIVARWVATRLQLENFSSFPGFSDGRLPPSSSRPSRDKLLNVITTSRGERKGKTEQKGGK